MDAASFPSAEGPGAASVGGRGGKVLLVNSLADSGPGTLRAALDASGARTVIFRVGGTITLQSPLVVRNPYLTIAGQSAPGGGIQLRNDPNAPYGLAGDSFTSLVIDTHDVVVRYLRIRPGPLTPNPACKGPNSLRHPQRLKSCVDANDIQAIEISKNGRRVMLDHLSLAWASDEVIDMNGAQDVTLQWSIVAEGMDYVLYGGNYTKKSPYNGHGVITGSTSGAKKGEVTGRLAFHHDLFAMLMDRAPQANVNCPSPSSPLTCASDVVNNYVYDWQESGVMVTNLLGHSYMNVVGNYFRSGGDTKDVEKAFRVQDWGRNKDTVVKGAKLGVYSTGNLRHSGRSSLAVGPYCKLWNGGSARWDPCASGAYVTARWPTPPITTTDAATAQQQVLGAAGASLRMDANGIWLPARDTADDRIVSDASNGTGRIIDSYARFPGWPTLANAAPPVDQDSDGMPDAWEYRWCVDPRRADSALDADGDGYTNLEEYLNGTRPCR